jgi:hypothetical protein
MRFFVLVVIGLSFLLLVSQHQISIAHAQFESLRELPVTIASAVRITSETPIPDGAIVVSSGDGFRLSSESYQQTLYGVVVYDPAILLNQSNDPNSYPVVTTGNARVLVTTQNGEIRKGDYITSSDRAGIGMKASRSGYVLGSALEDLVLPENVTDGYVLVSLRTQNYIAPANLQSNLQDIFDISAAAAYQQPVLVFRYVVAALVVILSIFLGIFYFGRIVVSGVEALGRNPLAGRRIQISVIVSVLLAIMVVGSGVAVAVFILRL